MSLSKTRIIGFALGIILLTCLMDKEVYGYDGKLFHEKILDLTIEMMSSRYPNLPQKYLKRGSTQPDDDREKFQKNPGNLLMIPKDNEEHKRDTTRINRNYSDAIRRYKKLAGEGKREEAQNEGARILTKAFHYVSDQTEPERGGFREAAQNMLQAIMANDKAKKHFFDKVNRLCQQYQFNPGNEDFVGKEIPKIRDDLERAIKDKKINEIDSFILDYLAKIVAIQNLMLEEFVKETKIESWAFNPAQIHTKSPSSPLKTEAPPSVTKDMKVREDRCSQIESALQAASQKDIERFRALVEQAKVENCNCYESAYIHLQNWEQRDARCNQIDAALVMASKANDINRFRALVEQAKAEKCNCYENAYNHLRQWEQSEERCRQIDLALTAASQSKDINRFRILVEQAKVEKCNCYQNAYNHLRNWEQQLQRSSIKPQPPPRPTPSQPRATPGAVRRTVSGGLDQEEVRKRVDGRRAEGASIKFQSGTVTLEINPGGAARISGNLTFEGQFRRPPTAPPDTRRHTFSLYPGQCDRDGSFCTGKGSRTVDHVYPTGRRSWPSGEIEWRASRQADGSYVFWVPNGEAPLWSEVTYRLR